jgi:hypothetical protein
LVRLSYHFWHDPGFGDDLAGDHLPLGVGAVSEANYWLSEIDGWVWRVLLDSGQWQSAKDDGASRFMEWTNMNRSQVPRSVLNHFEDWRELKGFKAPWLDEPTFVERDDNTLSREEFMQCWLTDHMQEVFGKTIPKAVEYGSHDLRMMGEEMLEMFPQLKGVVSPEELGIAFYLRGKVARLFGAYIQGDRPSDDTWLDTEVYAQMAQYVRQNGRWG